MNVLAPTAAAISIGGRILTADGRGIKNARVTLSGPGGTPATVLTGSFGYYHFEGVVAGQTVIITIASKRFQFSHPTRVITAMDNIGDADFTA